MFEVSVLDVPARRRDLVEGTHEVTVETMPVDSVAVRIMDMPGEEILVVQPR